MSEQTPKKEFEIDDWEFWWHRKSIIRTFVACTLFCVGQLLWIEHIKPPEGHVYERLPTLTGSWSSSDCGNGYTCSRVGSIAVSCGMASFFPFGGAGRGGCGHLNIPNGQDVTAIMVKTPMVNGHYAEYLAIVKSALETYKSDGDEQIRKKWIYQSRSAAFDSFFMLFIIAYLIQLGIYKSKHGG